ncbi:SAM-dependent methyltransferase [Amycolatopsis sp. FDAARGOS 1241]|uniref:SAM-dependent methyltransferase n=1 Tax=Amycolatopsis sp. FDAARGOS 1241 TaxID=2778070 RepID=UPI00194F8EEC|nr:SAM-dependent methyltransferase [Amycolatopsis sp. FDAARGOS 1241]QRP50104.1 SAM-dependent methyltransferase [Amycolatopsis sp. FDAARGOS 1241]
MSQPEHGERSDLDGPPGVDPSRASVARVYDYLLGGSTHHEVDRQVAHELTAKMPELRDIAVENRSFLIRASTFLARNAEIDQYFALGSGLPTAENVHQVVQRVNRESRVVYTDYDPVVTAHGRALLEENDRTRYIEGDVFTPGSILDHEVVLEHLDRTRPMALFFVATLHHWKGDRGRPAEVTREFIDRLPAGSFAVISHVVDPHDGSDDARLLEDLIETIRRGALGGATVRTRAEIRELFHGLELVPPGSGAEPDIVPLARWWPAGPLLGEMNVGQRLIVGASLANRERQGATVSPCRWATRHSPSSWRYTCVARRV